MHPFLGFGRALSERGHEVYLLANAIFRPAVEHGGLTFVECGDAADYEDTVGDPDLWHPRKGLSVVMLKGVAPLLAATYAALDRLATDDDTLLIASSWGFAAHLLAEARGLPLVMVQLQPIAFRSVHRAPRFPGLAMPDRMPRGLKRLAYRVMDRVVDPVVCPALNEERGAHGLTPVARPFEGWVHEADRTLAFFPDWFGPPQPDWPQGVRCVGFPLWDQGQDTALDDDLQAWLDAGPPPIVFTLGSANRFVRPFLEESAQAAALLGRRALLVTTEDDQLPTALPAGVRHARFPPFSRLFPQAAAVVHHGGIGTTSLALAAGVPSVAAPLGFDQPDNASRLVDLGVGASLPIRRYRARRVAALLEGLLDDEDCRARCVDIAQRLRGEDALAAACVAVEDLTTSRPD